MDNYKDFEDLRNNEPVASFDIAFKDRKSRFLIFSPHAGGIEQGTSEICLQIAGNMYSHYLFSGKGNNCNRLHITSVNFDEPVLTGLLSEHQFAISIHGMNNDIKKEVEADIFLGGLNRILIGITTEILKKNQFETTNNIENPESKLSGKAPGNVTNKCISGAGMQVEISGDLRSTFFNGDFKKKSGRKETTLAFKSFCDAIMHSIAIFEEQETRVKA